MSTLRSMAVRAGLGAALLPAMSAFALASPLGVWLNDTGRGAIEIKDCGGKLCGHVVWLRDTSDVKGCGRQIIGEARQTGAGLWDNGWIYSPEKKKKYDVELKPLADGTLRVKGYAGSKFFSRTMIWKPAPAGLQRCAMEAAAADAPAPAPVPAKVPAPVEKPAASAPVASAPATPAPPVAELKKATEPAPAAPVTPAEPKPTQDTAAAPPPAAEPVTPNDEVAADAPETADDSDGKLDLGKITDRLAELERETGYGLKRGDDGSCRLKVPFATVNFRCRE